MKMYDISINMEGDSYLNFTKVKPEDVSEIIRLLALYSDINNITINKAY